jgi:hypothetical protein
MNPFALEGLDIHLDTWRWLYLRQDQEIKIPKDKAGLAHLNTFVRHGLLVYSRGSFCLTDLSREVLLKVSRYEEDLREGIPLSYKTTQVSLARGMGDNWIKGKTREKKTFYTNNEIILFSDRLRYAIYKIAEVPLETEVLITQIQKSIFAEGFIDVYPRVLQRSSFFEPGVIWFKGSLGEPVAIKELYYDLVINSCRKVIVDATYVKITLDKEYVVAINPCLSFRYFEDIFAIISSF